jgi:TolB protein
MKTRYLTATACALGIALVVAAQQSDILIKITKGERAAIAVPDLRGSGGAQPFMGAFNETLYADLETSGLFRMVPKTMYPIEVPQRPQDFRKPAEPAKPTRGQQAAPPAATGLWLADWAGPPTNATYLTVGYAGVQGDRLVLFGWLYNVTQQDLNNAQVFGKIYFGTMDGAGARKVAHEFAADIMAQFGYKSLLGSKIYFDSDRTGRGQREIWSMDSDGSNQKQLTTYKSLSLMPAVSPDGTKIAFTSYSRGNPVILLHSLVTGGRLPFYNQTASMNATPDFTPDGGRIVFSSTAAGSYAQLYVCNADGSGLKRLTYTNTIDIEPKVNPKTGNEIVFVSGRSGIPQLYKMNLDGADVQRLTSGEGDAVNPSWHPDGQHVAFSWTRGFAPGNYNIFVMDVATRQFVQLTHGAGRNENPVWAPDGRHLAFSSNREGGNQIWTMLADGTQLRKLTTQGNNLRPVWK